jgi:hypothetical protein
VVAKFRLRDYVNSQDVLDFQMIFSPNDEIVAVVDRNTNGQPQVNFNPDERSCRVPWNNGANTFVAPGGTVSAADAQEGHLEVITMVTLPVNGFVTPPLDGDLAVHGSGQNCGTMSTAILSGTQATLKTAYANAGAVANGNVLRGAYSITSAGGYSGGGQAIPVANWHTATTLTSAATAAAAAPTATDAVTAVAPFNSGVIQTAATTAAALGGSTAASVSAAIVALGTTGAYSRELAYAQNANLVTSTQLDGADTQEWSHPHIGDSGSVANIDALMGLPGAGQNQVNNWSTNPTNGVGIDWVVTYFTKYLWRDALGFYGPAGAYTWPTTGSNNLPVVAHPAAGGVLTGPVGTRIYPLAGLTSPWAAAVGAASSSNGGRCFSATIGIRDREEGVGGGGVSPGAGLSLCNEAEVVGFTTDADGRRWVLRDTGAVVINATTSTPQSYGWASLTTGTGVAGVTTTGSAVAVGGFSYTVRDLGDPTTAYGALTAHSAN